MLRPGFCLALLAFTPLYAQSYTAEPVAGTGTAGFAGDAGPAFRALLNEPRAVALDGSGRLYIADALNHRVRRIDAGGVIRTVAGNGESGNAGDGGPAISAALDVMDIAADSAGVLYIVGGNWLRAVSAEGLIWTVAGPEAGLVSPTAVAVEQPGIVIVADGTRLLRIRIDGTTAEITNALPSPAADVAVRPDGTVLAAAGDRVFSAGADGSATPVTAAGSADANTRIASDGFGDLYLISGGTVIKLAGDQRWPLGGTNAADLTVDPGGNVYFASAAEHRVSVLRAPLPGAIAPVVPASQAAEVWPRDLLLRWTAVRDAKLYDVWFGTAPDALQRLGTAVEPAFPAGPLKDQTTYYWRVTTRVLPMSPVVSPVFAFTTTTITGLPPETPRSPSPASPSSGLPASMTLSWTGTGAAAYHVYLGTTEAALAFAGTTGAPRFKVYSLAPNTAYFWRVVAANDYGSTPSPVWQFGTGPAAGFPWLIETIAGRPLPQAEGSVATEVALRAPKSPAADSVGNVYFIENGRRLMRMAAGTGRLSVLFAESRNILRALAVDPQGNVYIGLPEYVLRITRNGQRSAYAGQPGGTEFREIAALAIDRSGRLYVADTGNHRVAMVPSAGNVRTLAGNGACGDICAPTEVAADSLGTVYVYGSGRILRIRTDGVVELVTSADSVTGLAADASGTLHFAQSDTMLVRRVTSSGLETVAGEPDANGSAFGFFGDGLPSARARFAFPDGIGFNPSGELLIGDSYNNRIRKVDSAGFVSTIAGADTAGEDRTAASASMLLMPSDVAVAAGTLYVADSGNHRVRRVWPNRLMETVAEADMTQGGVIDAGSDGVVVFSNDRLAWAGRGGTAAVQILGGSAIDTPVRRLGGVARGPGGELYVSDPERHRILRLAADGTAAVVAGTGGPGFSGDGGPAHLAQLHTPTALALSPDGQLYVAEFGRVRSIQTDGRILTVINEHANGVATDRLGNLYLSTGRSVFMLTSAGQLTRIAGNDSAPAGMNNGGLALNTRLNDVRGLAVSASDEIWLADAGDHVVRRLVRNVPRNLTITAGNNQTVAAGATAPLMSIRVTGASGQPVPGVPVQFAFISAPVRAITTVTTNNDGVATMRPNLVNRTGTVTIRAAAAGLEPVDFAVTVTAP